MCKFFGIGKTDIALLKPEVLCAGAPCQPKEVFVDLGYRGVDVQHGTKVYHPKLKRNITQRLRRDIRRRSAIEAAIGHMKNDGRLRRNWLKGTDGDAFHALLCSCGTTCA